MQVILKEPDFKNDALTPVGKWVIEFNLNDGVDTLKAGIQKGGEAKRLICTLVQTDGKFSC